MLTRFITPEWALAGLALVGIAGVWIGWAFARLRWRVRCSTVQVENERLKEEKDFLSRQLAQAEQQKAETLRMLRAGYDEAKSAMADRLRDMELHWKEQQKLSLDQFRILSSQILADNAMQLKSANHEQMSALLAPLRQQIEGLGQAVQQTNTASASNTASIGKMVELMLAKADRLSSEATNLTKALKGDTKKQGDWGELVLERMLEESGLKKGEEYFIQQTFQTPEGLRLRPDVVVRFPDERSVVIDSKVSLTAYAAYSAAEDESERARALAAHVASVRKHMEELAAKDYAGIVEESVGYVLMFIPNEASYIAAVQACPELPLEGYRKRVLIISPTNLLMALQLAYNLWQKERQTRNVEAIFAKAASIYDKCVLLTESFEEVGKNIRRALDAHEQARLRFRSGKGNLTRQVEDLRQMGISPAKRLDMEDE